MSRILIATLLFFACCLCLSVPAQSAEEKEVGVFADKVVVGTSVPLSGPAALWGMTAKGMEAYFKFVNDQGEVNGRKIELIIRDDAYNPTKAVANIRELSDKVFTFAGLLGTAVVQAVRDIVAEKKIPVVFAYGDVRMWVDYPKEKLRYFFISYPDYADEGEFLAKFAVEKLGAKKIAVFYQNDSYGKGGLEGVKRFGKVAVAVPHEVTDTDFFVHAQKIKESGADTLILYTVPRTAPMILKELAKIGVRPKVLSSFTLADPVMFKLAGDLWEGVYVAGMGIKLPGVDPEGDRIIEILAKYEPKVKDAPNMAMYGANTGMVFVEALKRTGKDITREKFIEAMESLKNFSTELLAPLTFSPQRRHGSNTSGLMKAEKGKYVRIIPYVEFNPLF